MNYFKIHDIKPEELRDRFMKALKDTNISPWRAAKNMKLVHTSLSTFFDNPAIIRYKTAAAIHNWTENVENRFKDSGQTTL